MGRPLYDNDADRELMTGARLRNIHNVEWALRNGANVNARDAKGRTALFHAGYLTAQMLLEHGADVHARSKDGRTALFSRWDDSARRSLLVAAGADPNTQDVNGLTPLHAMLEEHQQPAAVHLLSLGATPSFFIRDHQGRCPMEIAGRTVSNERLCELQRLYAAAEAEHIAAPPATAPSKDGGRL
jgi:ankyrin repeat protein